ncbi:unnamed protein product [Heterotrigona itama]|uniref:Uncharacterized protein n=1 Tax=Heterotrigona itama TaxID=395501 RepID=A0A6V7GWE6_9HYME|nr:unnamed protein product [Heterotrigona itama]
MISKCETCQRENFTRIRHRELAFISDTIKDRNNKIAMDIYGPLQMTSKSNQYMNKLILLATLTLVIGEDIELTNLEDKNLLIQKVFLYHNEVKESPEINVLKVIINTLENKYVHYKNVMHLRVKTGLFNFVGSISKTLFDTLDDSDLELINQNIDKLFHLNNKIIQIQVDTTITAILIEKQGIIHPDILINEQLLLAYTKLIKESNTDNAIEPMEENVQLIYDISDKN